MAEAAVELHPTAQPPHVVKYYPRKNRRFKGAKYRVLRALGGQVPVEYRTPAERCRYEADCLAVWAGHGFAVPRVLAAHTGEAGGRVRLCLSWCEGERLDAVLRDGQRSVAERLHLVAELLGKVGQRHRLAIRLRDHRLVQFDSNLGNTLVTAGGPVWIDFASGRSSEPVQRSCVRELTKLCVAMARCLGREHLDTVVTAMRDDYAVPEVLELGVRDSTRGVLQPLHRLRDRWRRKRRPVTRVDLYEALERAMRSR